MGKVPARTGPGTMIDLPAANCRRGRRSLGLTAALVAVGLMAAACAEANDPVAVQEAGLSEKIVPADAMTISVADDSTLPVAVVVNGEVAGRFTGGQSGSIPATGLPSLPWTVDVRSPSGRIITSLVVKAGDVWQDLEEGGTVSKGPWTSVTLSCGDVTLWSWADSPPPSGSGLASPGDCDP